MDRNTFTDNGYFNAKALGFVKVKYQELRQRLYVGASEYNGLAMNLEVNV
jgi:hypothetical protein